MARVLCAFISMLLKSTRVRFCQYNAGFNIVLLTAANVLFSVPLVYHAASAEPMLR